MGTLAAAHRCDWKAARGSWMGSHGLRQSRMHQPNTMGMSARIDASLSMLCIEPEGYAAPLLVCACVCACLFVLGGGGEFGSGCTADDA